MRVKIATDVDKLFSHSLCRATSTSRMSPVKTFTGRVSSTDIEEEEYKQKAF